MFNREADHVRIHPSHSSKRIAMVCRGQRRHDNDQYFIYSKPMDTTFRTKGL